MRPKIYLFGDSITEASFCDGGWGSSLAHHFCRTVYSLYCCFWYIVGLDCLMVIDFLCGLFEFQVDVVLRGYSGYNTRWALKVAEKVFTAVKGGGGGGDEGAPIAVTVFFGANDACLPDRCSAFQHVPIHEYKQNLQSIVSFLKVPSLLSACITSSCI